MKTCFVLAYVMAFAQANGEPYEDPASEVLDQCSDHPQVEMRACLERRVRDSAKALAHAEARTADSLSRWDEDEQFVARARDRPRASQSAFMAYRNAQCAFAKSLGGGAIGNALELRRLACIYALNTQREASLARLAAGISPK